MMFETPTGFLSLSARTVPIATPIRRIAVSSCGDRSDAYGHGVGLQFFMSVGGLGTLMMSPQEALRLAHELIEAAC